MLTLSILNKLSLNVVFFATTTFVLVQCDQDVGTNAINDEMLDFKQVIDQAMKTFSTTKAEVVGTPNTAKNETDIETFINKLDDKVVKPFEEISRKAKYFEEMFADMIKQVKDAGFEDEEEITAQLEGNETEMARMRDDLMAQVKELTALAGEAAQLKTEGDAIVLNLNTKKVQLETEIKQSEKELIRLGEESKANEKLLAVIQEILKKEKDEFNQAEKEFNDSNKEVERKKNKCIGVREIATSSGRIEKRSKIGNFFKKHFNKAKDKVQSAVCKKFNVGAIRKSEHNLDQKRISQDKEKHDVDVKMAEIAKILEKISQIEKQNKAVNDTIAKDKENIDILMPKLSQINNIQSKLSSYQLKIEDLTSKLNAAVKNMKLDLIREGIKTDGAVNNSDMK